ncbi:unnamed protein product [Schistosoma turkestanicum]|nr:unnamed protein product [Schistosoma turkestanicum]
MEFRISLGRSHGLSNTPENRESVEYSKLLPPVFYQLKTGEKLNNHTYHTTNTRNCHAIFHLQTESEKQLEIERQKDRHTLLEMSTLQSYKNSLESIKNQISLPCLYRHIYSLSKDDLRTMKKMYGFEV